MVHAVAATKDTVGPMLMKTIPDQATGGATLKRQASMGKKKYGKHALKIQTALGIEHVAAVVSTKAMKNHNGMFVSFNYRFFLNNILYLYFNAFIIKVEHGRIIHDCFFL
jgi:hypothetical protein